LVEGGTRGGAFVTGVGDRFPTSYVSCCSCIVRAARVVLMLFLALFCLLESCYR